LTAHLAQLIIFGTPGNFDIAPAQAEARVLERLKGSCTRFKGNLNGIIAISSGVSDSSGNVTVAPNDIVK
jgi:hypothetical protein